jgi:hypothetical protein
MRRFTVLFVLAFALALPAIASATEVGGSVSESFTLEAPPAPTISMTVPVSTVYAVNVPGHSASGDITLTGIGTNNINGLTIRARFSDLYRFVAGANIVEIPTTSRAFVGMLATPADLTMGEMLLGGSIADDATWYEIASSTVSLTGASAQYAMIISGVTVPGDYTGSIEFLASTNPTNP